MSGYKIELNWDMVDDIVVGQLKDTYDCFMKDLERPNHVFVYGDHEADRIEIQKRIDALKLMLDWYVTPEQLQKWGFDA